MPAVPTVVTDAVLEHRRRLSLDRQDERWEGEWRLVNPPKIWHAHVAGPLYRALANRADERGLVAYPDATGIFAADDDWRIPDQAFARPGSTYGDAGLATAELVVEIHSPGDDSYRKLPFYAQRGVREVLILHRSRRVELYRPDGRGDMAPVDPQPDGTVVCEVLDVRLSAVAGPRLRITWTDGATEI